MTHATKAIYRWLLSDYIKVSTMSDEMLFTEADLEQTMERIVEIKFHEEKIVNGIKFWCYHAGHVLGACQYMIEIAGVKVQFTGDFSREEDRKRCKNLHCKIRCECKTDPDNFFVTNYMI